MSIIQNILMIIVVNEGRKGGEKGKMRVGMLMDPTKNPESA
jgi:hypothetical protein